MVYEVPLDKQGRAAGVHYIDKSSGARHLAAARAVVLAASTGETARILLNSTSGSFPNGLANSSGQVGRNLTDSVAVTVGASIPALQGLPPLNEDGAFVAHAYVPFEEHRDRAAGLLNFATEYHVDVFGGRAMPSADAFGRLRGEDGKLLYGLALRRRLRHDFGSGLVLNSLGGMIPNPDCRCEIDPVVKDRWGIPVLRFYWKYGEQELEQARHVAAKECEMVEAMGGQPTIYTKISDGGAMSHELGTARMGAKPGESVLNAFGRTWDVHNLYVADGAAFVSHADKNPTETILALAWRASDHLVDSFVRKEI
jgi:choline dehydrogenase-like flavoprotein